MINDDDDDDNDDDGNNNNNWEVIKIKEESKVDPLPAAVHFSLLTRFSSFNVCYFATSPFLPDQTFFSSALILTWMHTRFFLYASWWQPD